MLQFKGVVEKEIGGKIVLFKFNMATLTMFGDLQNASLAEVGAELANPRISTLVNFLYAGTKVYDRQEKPSKLQNYSQDDAAEWIEKLGFDEGLSLMNEAFDAPEIKNGQAPK